MAVAVAVKRWLAPLVKALAPTPFWRRKYAILSRLGETNPEIQLVRSLCAPDRLSLDIGADVGEFAIAMAAASRGVIAFEPRPTQARELSAMFDAVGAAVRVETTALSDRAGVTAMRVLDLAPGRSTIDHDNELNDTDGSAVHTIDVPVTPLDALQLDDVGLVKIDVEGHELAVLRGAVETLRRNRPTLVIEAEERHHRGTVAAITEFLAELGYTGSFELDGVRQPIEEFDAERHQTPANIANWAVRGSYVNNFVFVPA